MSAIRFGPLDHCSILTTDLAKARAFYAGVLGLKEIAKPKTFEFVVIWFDIGGGQTLHLLQKPQPDARSPRHFALTVADAKAAREHIRAFGVVIEETTPIPHCDRFFVHDPDGNRVELIQWLEPYDPAASGAPRFD
jgi:catechol 2,3-dioxygenase-like lactoylglutathione lyase family enzyme